jgi:phage tail protein X
MASVTRRRDGALVGWLTAAFRADDFMRGLLGDGPPALEFEVYDGSTAAPEALLYSTAGIADTGSPLPLAADLAPVLDHVSHVELPGRTWTLRYRATPELSPLTDRLAPWLIVTSGLFAAILFYVMSRAGARPGMKPDLDGRWPAPAYYSAGWDGCERSTAVTTGCCRGAT